MYEYLSEKEKLFTDEGQRLFLKVRDHVKRLLKQAGAVRMQEAISVEAGEVWLRIACVDRLVELDELREVIYQGSTPGQCRIFVNSHLAEIKEGA